MRCLWRYTIPAATGDPVIGREGLVIAGAGNGRLYAIPRDGHKQWDTQLGASLEHAAAVAGTVFVAAGQHLVAVAGTGEPLWCYPLRDRVTAAVLGADGTIYTSSADWVMYAFAGSAGGLLAGAWSMQHGQPDHSARVGASGGGPNPIYVLLDSQVQGDSVQQKHAALDHIATLLEGDLIMTVGIGAIEALLEYARARA